MSLINQFAIQLYSVRDITEKDFKGTLEKLSKMGYTGVEFAGYGGLSAQEMKEVLVANSLSPIGSHIGMERLTKHLDEEIAYHKVLGTEYLICPSSGIKTGEDALKLADTFKPIIEKISGEGLKFAYHNHAYEFDQSNGEYLLDILFENLPQEAVMELDVYWSAYAGVDSLSYMEKHKNRLKLLHIKQIDKEKQNVDLNNGILDFNEIITKAKIFGTEHFIFEQERYEISSMTSAKNGVEFILKL